MTDTIAHRICPFCEASCGLELTLSGGQVKTIRGHADDVFSAGFICPKGVALKDLHEDPDRLRTPLIKRDGRFVETTWDEAFAEIERRLPPLLAQHGRNSVAVTLGNPVAHRAGLSLYAMRFNRALRTRNIFSASTLDQIPKHLSSGLMFGEWMTIAVPDIERTDFLLILGANPMVSNGSLWTVPNFRDKAKALRARGGKLVVVDPRRTDTAKAADEHIFIRPGADVFFLLGMTHTLFEEKLVKLGRLAEHVTGVESVEAAVAGFSAEKMSARCGIPAATIRGLARRLAATPRALVYGRIGTCTQEYGSLSSWLVDVLNILTGHLDEPGGAMFPKAAAFAANTMGKSGTGRGIVTGRRHGRVSGLPEVMGELPMTCLAEEIETPGAEQVRALITVASNPVLSSPNGPRLSAAFEKLDFMVSLDVYLNATTRHADVILPDPSPLEEMHYDIAFSQLSYRNHARFSRPVLPPQPGHPAEWQILLRLLAIIEGKGAQVDVNRFDDELVAEDVRRMAGPQAEAILKALEGHRGPERLIDLALRSGPYGDQFGMKPEGINLDKVMATEGGIDLGPLAPRIPEILRTPSGKIELAPAMLLEDLKRPAADLARPAPDMVIVGRRQLHSNNSWMHNLPVLAKSAARCTALVNPEDAQRLGLRHGGKARIARNGSSVEVQVEVTDEMMPGVVSLPHGWGHNLSGTKLNVAAVHPGANLNALLDDNLRDPLSGNAVLSGVAVKMEAVG
ncbi:MAG TPA: molybdopterin-dependent oxidoreductase [Candidatus Saccharimonadales bacterium]|jgi:anaerobic selenocysteine-containing dehydrogenase|nr:molybdopterin-dependent oxidoreductase [Candidatus Saccharimonadales bacterium]